MTHLDYHPRGAWILRRAEEIERLSAARIAANEAQYAKAVQDLAWLAVSIAAIAAIVVLAVFAL